MEELCEIGLKNLRTNFQVEERFSVQNVPRYFPSLIMSTPKPDNFMQLFWLVLLYVLDAFLYVPGIRMNTLLDLFQVTF